jgi:hypothetical protein
MIPVSLAKKNSFLDKKRIPIGKAEIYDTPYSVPSRGFRIEFYQGGNIESETFGDIRFAGNDSKIMYDWGEGVPEAINGFPYQICWLGYFYARFSGVYTFYAYGPNASRIVMMLDEHNGIMPQELTYVSDLLIEKPQNAGSSVSGDTFALVAGTWYPIKVEYWNAGSPSYVAVLYREPDSVQDSDGKWSDYDSTGANHYGEIIEEHKVLSAGVVNYDETWFGREMAEFLSPVRLPVLSINGSKKLNEISEYSFEIGLDNENTEDTYYYDNINDVIQFTTDDNVKIKKNRLVKIYTGYQLGCDNFSGGTCTNTYATGWLNEPLCSGLGNPSCPFNQPDSADYTETFTGFVTNFAFNRQKGSDNSAEIICKDVLFLALNSLDENYPNTVSYAVAEYNEEETDGGAGPNGISKPRAYDGWRLDKAIRDLLLHANIDATLLYEKTVVDTVTAQEYFGKSLLEGKDIRLRKNYYYGVTDYVYPEAFTVNDPEPSDSEQTYNFVGEFGDKLFDRISSLAEAFGFLFGADNSGNIYFKSIGTPTQYDHTSTDSVYGFTDINGFVEQNDIKALRGGIFYSDEETDSITCRAFGSKFDIIMACGPDSSVVGSGTSMFEHCIDDVVTGGYSACNPEFETKILGIDQTSDTSIFVNNGYIAFRANKTFTLDKIQLNISRVLNAFQDVNDFDSWKFNIHLAGLSAYPSGYSNFSSATYSTVLATGISVSTIDTVGMVVINVNNTNVTSGSYYAIRFSTSAIPDDGINCGAIFVNAVRGGNKFPYTYSITSYPSGTSNYYEDNLWSDIDFIAANDLSAITISVVRVYDTEEVFSDNVSTYFSEEWYYYDGINATIGRNPTVFTINAQDLNSQNSYRGYNSADVYDITITNNSDSPIRLEGILAYNKDMQARAWAFTTADLSSLDCNLLPEDIRNDIFIVGTLKGPVRNLTGKIINPNNPTLEYVYSRATDLNSIYGIDYSNSVGGKRQFILQLPNVATDEHANWLAVGALMKFRNELKEVSAKTNGINILELGDCIGIQDLSLKTINIGTNLWISDQKETISNDALYTSEFSLSSIEPWESYRTKEEPDISLFVDSGGNEQAFIDISVTTTLSGVTGYTNANNYDCYESEAQNYIKIEYQQVINGNVKIYICSTGEHTPIAILVPPVEGGIDNDSHVYQDWGKHEVLWDGICWNKIGRPKGEDIGYYVEDMQFVIAFELIKDGNIYKIFSDNLPTENGLNDNAEVTITTSLNRYPTAGTLTVNPSGCDGNSGASRHYGNQLVSCLSGDTIPIAGAPKPSSWGYANAFYSRPNQISCADFNNESVSYRFSVSGYHQTLGFVDRWITGNIKIYCVESIVGDKFADERYVNRAAMENLGKFVKITEDAIQALDGFYTIDKPATRNVNPTTMLGKFSNSLLEFNKVEMKNDFTDIDLTGFIFEWDYSNNYIMYNKAVIIDCSELKDRAGRMVWQYFTYGTGLCGHDASPQGTASGYRLCRHDRLFGCNYTEWSYDDEIWTYNWNDPATNGFGCGLHYFLRCNDWCRTEHFPEILGLMGTDIEIMYRTCSHSNILQTSGYDFNYSGEHEGTCPQHDCQSSDKCTFYQINDEIIDGEYPHVSMVNSEITSRYVLNHIIYWHPSGYTHVPFSYGSQYHPPTMEIGWRASSRWYSNVNHHLYKDDKYGGSTPMLTDVYYTRMLIDDTDLKENESGQILTS